MCCGISTSYTWVWIELVFTQKNLPGKKTVVSMAVVFMTELHHKAASAMRCMHSWSFLDDSAILLLARVSLLGAMRLKIWKYRIIIIMRKFQGGMLRTA
jgi:hypothetical protein